MLNGIDYKRNPERAAVRMLNDEPDLAFRFEGEHNAWRYGRDIVPKYRSDLLSNFEELNKSNIAFWRKERLRLVD